MSGWLSFLFSTKQDKKVQEYTVSVAESVTAGALANTLCAEPGASKYFKGGVITYNIISKKEILGVDTVYAEQNNFANVFTTLEMAKAVCKMFKSRIGMATTGYSLPTSRPENKERNECVLNIENPYAIICLYDSVEDAHIIKNVTYKYDESINKKINRASVQTKVALEGRKMYQQYIKKDNKPVIYSSPKNNTKIDVNNNNVNNVNKQTDTTITINTNSDVNSDEVIIDIKSPPPKQVMKSKPPPPKCPPPRRSLYGYTRR